MSEGIKSQQHIRSTRNLIEKHFPTYRKIDSSKYANHIDFYSEEHVGKISMNYENDRLCYWGLVDLSQIVLFKQEYDGLTKKSLKVGPIKEGLLNYIQD